MTIVETMHDIDTQSNMKQVSDEIRELRLAGNLEEATKLCTKARHLFPDKYLFSIIQADLYFQQNDYEATFIALGEYLKKQPLSKNRFVANFAKRYYRLQQVLPKEKLSDLAEKLCITIDKSSADKNVIREVKDILRPDMVSINFLPEHSPKFASFIKLLEDDLNFNEFTKQEKILEKENRYQLEQVLDKYVLTRERVSSTRRIDTYCASIYEKFEKHDKAIKLLTELLSVRIEAVAARSLFRICRTIKNYDSVDNFLSKNPALIKNNDFNILYELVYYFEAKNDNIQLQRVLSIIEKSFAQNLPILETLKNFYIRFGMLEEIKRLEPTIRSITKDKGKGKYVEELEESETEIASTISELNSQLNHQKQLVAISDLTTGISHELGQPITNIRYTIQFYKKLLEKNLTKDSVFKIFDSILEETERMGALIKRLSPLTSSRNVLETYDLIDRIKKRVQLEKPRLDDNHIKVTIASKVPVTVYGDSVKFDQLISNLLLNAIDAIKERNKTDKNKIDIKVEDGTQDVSIFFSDNGVGIPFKNKNTIFDPFFSTKAPGKGEGLGLFIVWNLLKSQGGKIIVDTSYTNGARFIITIPKTFNLEKETKL
ncbi:MAG: HAMP domain-containing sensor histidine kinase [Methylobacter sp.]|nr:HAMP domain-containing sensor histidine kinase [Methylobacter sp.]